MLLLAAVHFGWASKNTERLFRIHIVEMFFLAAVGVLLIGGMFPQFMNIQEALCHR
jgi:hypothetical protein